MAADGNRRGGEESVSGGIKASFEIKKGKQTLMITGRGLSADGNRRGVRERWNKIIKTIIKHAAAAPFLGCRADRCGGSGGGSGGRGSVGGVS